STWFDAAYGTATAIDRFQRTSGNDAVTTCLRPSLYVTTTTSVRYWKYRCCLLNWDRTVFVEFGTLTARTSPRYGAWAAAYSPCSTTCSLSTESLAAAGFVKASHATDLRGDPVTERTETLTVERPSS